MKSYLSKITVEWVHCDAGGIVFYPNFYTWFDQNTERLFKANGLSYTKMEAKYNLLGLPLLESGAQYKKACHHEDEIELHSFVEEWATKTLLMRHQILHKDGSEAMHGFERRAWVVQDDESEAGMRAAPIPEEVKELFVD
jgi:4-hydroxybenzoyl-CoA thioesterase